MIKVIKMIEEHIVIIISTLLIILICFAILNSSLYKRIKESINFEKEFNLKKEEEYIGYSAGLEVKSDTKHKKEKYVKMENTLIEYQNSYISADSLIYEEITIKVNGVFLMTEGTRFKMVREVGVVILKNVVMKKYSQTLKTDELYIFFDNDDYHFFSDKPLIYKEGSKEEKEYENFQANKSLDKIEKLGKEAKEVIDFMRLPEEQRNKIVARNRKEVQYLNYRNEKNQLELDVEKYCREKPPTHKYCGPLKNNQSSQRSGYSGYPNRLTNEELEKLDREENERERAESDEREYEDREEREYWESEEYWGEEGIEKEVY